MAPTASLAQQGAAAPGGTADNAPPADIQKTLDQVADLDLLFAIAPLKLNTDQIDSLTKVLDSIDHGGADLAAKNYEAVRALADEVATTRDAALKGTPPPDTEKTKIGDALSAIDKRIADAHKVSTRRLVTVIETSLTPEQIQTIEKQYSVWIGGKVSIPADYKNDPDGQKAYIEEVSLSSYSERILMNQRAIKLLKEMRAAAPAPGATTPDAAGAAPPPAPAAPGNP